MKFFGWAQKKLCCKQEGNRKPNVVASTQAPLIISTGHAKQDSREEFNDWPQGLLAIGTFGNNDLRHHNDNVEIQEDVQQQEVQEDNQEPSPSDDDLQDFTPEEIGKLQKELTDLLSQKPTSKNKGKEIAALPLDRFFNCPSTLEVSRRISKRSLGDKDDDDDDIEQTISLILGRCKDIRKNKHKVIGKNSVSFLLKKMFVCRSGFAPQASLRDMLQESRMEKLLRTLLHKKINPQNASRASSTKKLLQDKQTTGEENEDEKRHKKDSHGSKWVKTDSEYIVLEI